MELCQRQVRVLATLTPADSHLLTVAGWADKLLILDLNYRSK